MTTKWKVISGFLLMFAILVVVTISGYIRLNGASVGFTSYSVESVTSVNANGADALMREVQKNIGRFRLDFDQAHLTAAANHANRAINHYLLSAKELETNADEQKVLDTQIVRIRQLMKLTDEMQQKLTQATKMVNEDMAVAAHNLTETVLEMAVDARYNFNLVELEVLEEISFSFASARIWVRHYADMYLESSADKAEEDLATCSTALDKLDPILFRDEDRIFFDRVLASKDMYIEVFRKVRQIFNEVGNLQNQIDTLGNELTKDFDGYTERAENRMTMIGTAMQSSNARGQMLILTISIGGIIIGSLFACFIILSFIKIMGNVSRFASSIAEGDFQAQLICREGGEIGQMVQAMNAILSILKKLIADTQRAADTIYVGHYRTRLDAKTFPGAYQDLTKSINMVSEAYTKTLDEIPLAIFTADRDYKMHYLNTLSQTVAGGNKTGQTCGSCLKTALCNTDNCFAVNAIRSGKPATGETDVFPDGKTKMVLSVTALPLFDKAGVLHGFMEICSDITNIKKVQQTIRDVAEQAVSITHRVAAASEELSTQVALVSDGAKQQRARVESTAAAMSEMNSTVLEVAHNAGQASEQSEMTKNKAGDGAILVDKVVRSINLVNKVAAALQINMQELGAKAESIGGVMSVISDIADQTNLLALNAAIEAARAGDAGRGFAVVADEVRKLAEKTMTSTQEVGTNISAIQQSARSNIDEVNEAARAVTEATELANTSGQALSEIVNLAAANSAVVSSIATAAEKQSATSEEINQAIEEISKIVANTSDGMGQSATAVHELSKMAQELNAVVAKLRQDSN